MDDNKTTPSLIEYAFKELKKENDLLKDHIHTLPNAKEIKEKENLLNLQSAALESAANGIVITDIEGNINWVNSAFTKLTGYTKEESIGINPRILKSGTHDNNYYKNMWETILSGKVWKGELVNKRKDGTLYYEEMTITPVRNTEGIITNFIAIKQNVTERVIAKEKLVESENKFKAISDSTNDGIITINEKLEVIFWNKAAEKLFEYSFKEAIGKSIYELIIPERFLKQAKERMEKIITIGKDFRGKFEIIAKKKNGAEFNVELSVSLTQIDKEWHITGIWRDLTNTKKLKKTSESEKDKIITTLQTELDIVKSNYNILNTIINKLPQNIYVKDLNSRFIKINKATVKKLGFTNEDELLGKSDRDIFNSKEADSFIKEEQEIIKTGKPILGKEHKEVWKDGTIAWAQSSKFPLFNSENQIIGIFGITDDITERKRKEDELSDSYYKFRQLIENSTIGIMRIDTEDEIIMVNPALAEMLGYSSSAEIIAKKSNQLYFSIKKKNKFFQILKNEERVRCFEDVFIKKDGSLIDVKKSGWTIKDKNNNVIYYEIIVEDITEQNQILKILHESEFKYRMLIDKLNEAVYLLVGHKFEIVNSKFLELLEITEEEVNSPTFDMLNFIAEESKPMIINREERKAKGEKVPHKYEMILLTKSGIEKEVEVSVSYLDFKGKTATQGVVRDLTEIRRRETQIRHLQKMEAIGTLAAGIAHEINTPSQFISDNLSFLQNAVKDLEVVFKYLSNLNTQEENFDTLNNIVKELDIEYLTEEIPIAINQSKEGIERIANIVGAMRDFSHSGPKYKIATDLHKLIQNSITISRNAWKYVAEINKEFDETIPLIICLASDLGQVIVNIIVNAAHAIENKFHDSDTLQGKILIQTKNKNGFVEIIISDNGTGMPEKVKKRIFDPFFTTKEVGKGTGQGLAIAYDIIVDKHKGSIEVETEENIGTTFIISLPTGDKDEIK